MSFPMASEAITSDDDANAIATSFDAFATLPDAVETSFDGTRTQNSRDMSTLGETTGEDVYRGLKGSFHRKQVHPRKAVETDWSAKFAKIICDGDVEEANRITEKFFRLNGDKKTEEMADGMLAVLMEKGAKEKMLRGVFHIGQSRYNRILKNQAKQPTGGTNFKAITPDMMSQLDRLVSTGIPKELGFPCAHRRLMEYCTDEEISSWEKLYDKYYVPFEPDSNVRKMAYISFYNHMRAHHPGFKLRRLVEDACDTCMELNTKLKDKNLSQEDKDAIKKALSNHGALARNLRKSMNDAILLWKANYVVKDKCLGDGLADEVVERVMNMAVNEDAPGADWVPVQLSGSSMEMVCEDFAGNFHSPAYGRTRPGTDYYASKLSLYCFVIVNISEDQSYTFLYDERGMGKDMDAMCSIRLIHGLRQREKWRNRLADMPTMRFQVMDNCVGQNKSQAVFMWFALLSLTWYPDGFVCLFLLPGHSHFPADRTVSWLRTSIKGKNVYLPEHFVQFFNSIRSVKSEFVDHRSPNRLMFRGWDGILQQHFIPIPAIKGGGYTSFYFFEFKKGVVSMRRSPDSAVEYTHSYVQGLRGVDEGVPYEVLCERCVASLERHIWQYGTRN